MIARVVARPTPVVLSAAMAGLALLAAAAAVRAGAPSDAITTFAVVAVGGAGLLLAPRIDPAVPITAAIVLSTFSGNWGKLGVPLGLDRPLMVLGLVGVALRALPDSRRREVPVLRPVHLLLAGVAAYALCSAALAGTLAQREPLFALADKLGLISFVLFFVAPVAFRTVEQRNLLLLGLTALGGYLALTALFEYLEVTALVFPRYISDPDAGIHFGRARGPFLEAAANGLVLYMCAVAAAVAAFVWRRPWARAAAVAVVSLCALGIVLTLTRQIWLGATVATLVAMLAAAPLRRFAVPAVIVGAALTLGAFAVVPGLQDRAESRAGSRSPVWDRLNSNRAAVAMTLDRPLTGFGWYRWVPDSPAYYTQAADYPVTTVGRPHNVFLANTVELGLPITLVWLLALILALGGAVLRRAPPELEPWRIGLVAVAINWLVVANFTPLGYALPNYLVWLWAGIVAAGALAPGIVSRPVRRV